METTDQSLVATGDRRGLPPRLCRSAQVRLGSRQEEGDEPEIRLQLTSDVRLVRQGWFGEEWVEILEHGPENIRLERFENGLPLLLHHDLRSPDNHVGIITNPRRETSGELMTLAGDIRFSQNARPQEIRQDVLDGIRKDASGGYRVWRAVQEEEDDQGRDVYRITDWEPLEGSLEPVPADIAVGVDIRMEELKSASERGELARVLYRGLGAELEQRRPQVPVPEGAPDGDGAEDEDRSAADEPAGEADEDRNRPQGDGARGEEEAATTARINTEEDPMNEDRQNGGAATATREPASPVEVLDLAEEHAVPQRTAREWLERELSMNEVREELLELLAGERGTDVGAPPAESYDIPEREFEDYSLARAILAQMPDSGVEGGLEDEVSRHIAEKRGSNPEGIFVPTQALRFRGSVERTREALSMSQASRAMLAQQQRALQTLVRELGQRDALDTGTSGAASELVFTEPGSFIEVLRNRTMVLTLGATMLPGLRGDLAFPRQTGSVTANWVAEDPGADVAETAMAVELLNLSPRTLQATTATTRQLLRQAVSNIDLEDTIRRDIAMVHAVALDAAAINGSGSSNEPTGVLNDSGVGTVVMGDPDGGAIDWASAVEFEQTIAEANAEGLGPQAILTTPGVRAFMKTTEKATGTARFLWEEDQVNGYPGFVSNNVPSNGTKGTGTNLHAMIQGIWQHLLVGEWGALDIIVDPFAQKKRGIVELTSFQMADIGVRYPGAFAVATDIDTS